MSEQYDYSLNKEKAKTTIIIKRDLRDRVKKYGSEIDRSFNWILEKALEEYLKNNADNT